jgi:GNAT superfamily N-acetyltransferase
MLIETNQPKNQTESVRLSVQINLTPGIITITDANTTIGYCRYDDSGEIEYVFVNAAHRRKGYAKMLLEIAEERVATTLRFPPPISPLGERLVRFYNRQRQMDGGLDRFVHLAGPSLAAKALDP